MNVIVFLFADTWNAVTVTKHLRMLLSSVVTLKRFTSENTILCVQCVARDLSRLKVSFTVMYSWGSWCLGLTAAEYAKSARLVAHVRRKFQMSGKGVNSRRKKCPVRRNWAKCPGKNKHLAGHFKGAFIFHKTLKIKVISSFMSSEIPGTYYGCLVKLKNISRALLLSNSHSHCINYFVQISQGLGFLKFWLNSQGMGRVRGCSTVVYIWIIGMACVHSTSILSK